MPRPYGAVMRRGRRPAARARRGPASPPASTPTYRPAPRKWRRGGARWLPPVRSPRRPIASRLLPASEIERALDSERVEPERARLLARLARGRIGWALGMGGDPSPLERRGGGRRP